MAATAHLRAVDHSSGELVEATPEALAAEIGALHDEVHGLQRALKTEIRRYEELKRDKDAEARAHEAWSTLKALHDYWREQTGHTRARWTGDKFWMAWPLWREFKTGNCAAGIAGIGHEPNRKLLKNGKLETFDSWKLLFRDSVTLERYIVRREQGWTLPPQFEGK